MCLKIIEKNQHKDVIIKEGEVWYTPYTHATNMPIDLIITLLVQNQCYLHPSGIPHSPQRIENTVGLVIERDRTKDEFDGLR